MNNALRLVTLFFIATVPAVPLPSQAPTAAQGGSLTVSVTNLRNNAGQIFLLLWNSPAGFPTDGSKAYKRIIIDASQANNGQVKAQFIDIPPGTYAVSTLHDENRNGKLDTFFGIPKEGWAVSNNVVTRTHAPTFQQAEIHIRPEAQGETLSLHY